MEFLTDQVLFYGGTAAGIGALAGAFIYFCIAQIKRIRLNVQLDAEYGKKEENEGKRYRHRRSNKR